MTVFHPMIINTCSAHRNSKIRFSAGFQWATWDSNPQPAGYELQSCTVENAADRIDRRRFE
jgi:hypothetical protein